MRAELDFLTASSQQLIKMYLRRKEAEEEDEEEEERTEDGGNSCLQISYKLGYIQVYSYQRPESSVPVEAYVDKKFSSTLLGLQKQSCKHLSSLKSLI